MDSAIDQNLPVDMIDEDFYQQGMQCFRARLPRRLVRQALKAIATKTEGRGIPTTTRRLRCFAQGLAGLDAQGRRSHLVEEGFLWPEPPDASWKFVVLAFHDRGMEFDFVHPISRRFYSEDCRDSDLPPCSTSTGGAASFLVRANGVRSHPHDIGSL